MEALVIEENLVFSEIIDNGKLSPGKFSKTSKFWMQS